MALRSPLAVLAIVLAAGCGEDEGDSTTTTTVREPPARLSAAERERAFAAERAIAAYCGRVTAAVLGQAKPPPPRALRRALGRVDGLGELASPDPRAEVETGVSIRLFISDLAENLQGANCDPRVIARLDTALAALVP